MIIYHNLADLLQNKLYPFKGLFKPSSWDNRSGDKKLDDLMCSSSGVILGFIYLLLKEKKEIIHKITMYIIWPSEYQIE